jgi:hypothetical protein
MTGQSEHQSRRSVGSSSIPDSEVSTDYDVEVEGDESDDRIEIPAFLRRQAN